jgi:hypothetical protein
MIFEILFGYLGTPFKLAWERSIRMQETTYEMADDTGQKLCEKKTIGDAVVSKSLNNGAAREFALPKFLLFSFAFGVLFALILRGLIAGTEILTLSNP